MSRAPTRNKHLPAGMRARHRSAGTYYYLDTGEKPRREIPLGSDYVAAVQKWAELTAAKEAVQITFKHVTDRYIRDELPKKAPATGKDNLRELAKLLKYFEDAQVTTDALYVCFCKQVDDSRLVLLPVTVDPSIALLENHE